MSTLRTLVFFFVSLLFSLLVFISVILIFIIAPSSFLHYITTVVLMLSSCHVVSLCVPAIIPARNFAFHFLLLKVRILWRKHILFPTILITGPTIP
jgi:hypothetical protein